MVRVIYKGCRSNFNNLISFDHGAMHLETQNDKSVFYRVRKAHMVISDVLLLPANGSFFSRLCSLAKSLKRLKPFRWRRPLEAGEAPFLKGSRLGGGPWTGRERTALAFEGLTR